MLMPNQERIWKCECAECNCDLATPKTDLDIDAVCYHCSNGCHRAEREWKASRDTRKRIAKEEQELKDRED